MNILFVCTGNSCRSPMAECYCNYRAKQLGLDSIKAESAGTAAPGGDMSRAARKVLQENDIPVSFAESRTVSAGMVRRADFILTMTSLHKDMVETAFPEACNKTETLGKYLPGNGDVGDPIGGTIADYRACFRTIRKAVDAFLLSLDPH